MKVLPDEVAIAGGRSVVEVEVSTITDGLPERFRRIPRRMSTLLTQVGTGYGIVSRPQRISLRVTW
jgi:hypothetical protein